MKNPFRTEESAFRFLVLTIVYGALIVIGSKINTWVGLGVAVFVVLTLIVAWSAFFRSRDEAEQPAAVRPKTPSAPDEHRVLVIANETIGGQELDDLLAAQAGRANVLIVAPALNSPLGQLTGDGRNAHAEAQARLDATLGALQRRGVTVRGEIGESDPLQAIEDAMRTFGADEIVISTHPEGRSNWLEQGLVAKARERFAVPITHVVSHVGDPAEAR